jgi:tripartite ATP-independent transporter DctP family solute receptor
MRHTRRAFASTAGALWAFDIVRGPAKAAQFEFKCGQGLSRDEPSSVRLAQMWKAIEQESGGRLRTQFFPDGVLGTVQAMLTQVRVGALQFLFVPAGTLGDVVPSAQIGYLGFAFKDEAEGIRVFDGPLGDFVRNEAATKGMYTFKEVWDGGMFQVGSITKPIRTPEDLRGFKIRVATSKISLDLFRAFDASPVGLPYAEVYSSMQTKLIDGQNSSLAVIETAKFYEVQKYISLTNHAWTCEWLVANADVWKGLPPDLQAIVERNHRKYCLLERRDDKIIQASLADKLARRGQIINSVDQTPFRARLGSYYKTWASTFGSSAWGMLEAGLGRKLG